MRPVTLKGKEIPRSGDSYFYQRHNNFVFRYKFSQENIANMIFRYQNLADKDKCLLNIFMPWEPVYRDEIRNTVRNIESRLYTKGGRGKRFAKLSPPIKRNLIDNIMQAVNEYLEDQGFNGSFQQIHTYRYFTIGIDTLLEKIAAIYQYQCNNNGFRSRAEETIYTSLNNKIQSETPKDRIGVDDDYYISHKLAKKDLEKSLGSYCSYCEQVGSSRAFDIEHVLPKTDFPAHRVSWDNLLISCKVCNSDLKGTLPSRNFGIKQALKNVGRDNIADALSDDAISIDNALIAPPSDNQDRDAYYIIADAAKSALFFPHYLYNAEGRAFSGDDEDLPLTWGIGGLKDYFSSFDVFEYKLEYLGSDNWWRTFDDWKNYEPTQFREGDNAFFLTLDGEDYEVAVSVYNKASVTDHPVIHQMVSRTISEDEGLGLNCVYPYQQGKSTDQRIFTRTREWLASWKKCKQYKKKLEKKRILERNLQNDQFNFEDIQTNILEAQPDSLYYRHLYNESIEYEISIADTKHEIVKLNKKLESLHDEIIDAVQKNGHYSVWIKVMKEINDEKEAKKLAESLNEKHLNVPHSETSHYRFISTDTRFIRFEYGK